MAIDNIGSKVGLSRIVLYQVLCKTMPQQTIITALKWIPAIKGTALTRDHGCTGFGRRVEERATDTSTTTKRETAMMGLAPRTRTLKTRRWTRMPLSTALMKHGERGRDRRKRSKWFMYTLRFVVRWLRHRICSTWQHTAVAVEAILHLSSLS